MKNNEKIYRGVLCAMMITMTGLAGYHILKASWADLFVTVQALVISALPYFLEKHFKIHTPYVLRTGFVLFLFSTLVLGEIGDFYNTFWWWDLVLHMVSSAGITLIGFILMSIIYRDKDLKASAFLTSFLVFSFAICLAVIWEIYEFLIDLFFETDSPMQPSNADTMTDLIIAIVGSLAICFYGYRYIKRQSANNVVEEAIEEGKVNNL